MQYNTTITSKGQMTIPSEVRRKLSLKPGPVRLKVSGDSIKIEQNDWEKDLERFQARVREHMRKHGLKPLSAQELDMAIDDAAVQGATKEYLRKYGNK